MWVTALAPVSEGVEPQGQSGSSWYWALYGLGNLRFRACLFLHFCFCFLFLSLTADSCVLRLRGKLFAHCAKDIFIYSYTSKSFDIILVSLPRLYYSTTYTAINMKNGYLFLKSVFVKWIFKESESFRSLYMSMVILWMDPRDCCTHMMNYWYVLILWHWWALHTGK